MAHKNFEPIWKMMTENVFQIDTKISLDIICSICQKLMIRPTNSPCGCRYCTDCIINYLQWGHKSCPGNMDYCKEVELNFFENIFADQPITIKISKLMVKCPQNECEFRDSLRNMECHVKRCDFRFRQCPYADLGCKETRLLETEMKNHLTTDIVTHAILLTKTITEMRGRFQSFCGDFDQLLKIHSENKQLEAVLLQNKDDSQSHQMEQLNEKVAALTIENQSMKDQIESLLLKEKVRQTEVDELTRKTNEQSMKIENMEKDLGKMTTENGSKKLKNQTEMEHLIEGFLQAQRKETVVTPAKTEITALPIKSVSIDLNKSIRSVEGNIRERNSQWRSKTKYGECEWHIRNFSEKLIKSKNESNTFIYSSPFYSESGGYKMCLRADLNGVGTGKGTHLSVWYCIMKSPIDNLLTWPFNYDVKLGLINQKTGVLHTSKMIKFDSKYRKNIPNWNKPENDKNVGLGFSRFIRLDELMSNCELVQNDHIAIRCSWKRAT